MNRTGLTLFVSMLAATASGQAVINEGTGDRRAALDGMIYKDAPTTTILEQSEWIGAAPTLGDISGRPILVFTWAEWYRPSHAVAMLANRLASEHEDLVVIGVHDEEGWDEAGTFAERRSLSFPIVRDPGGVIRDTLKVDQDPDVYVFDRVGRVRYADITTESARAAVETVLGEDSAAASGIQDRLAAERAEAERQRRLSRSINEGVAFREALDVPFVKPTAEEYTAAAWPKWETPDNSRRSRQNDDGPVTYAVPAEGWYRDAAPNASGRVAVVYTWHPSNQSTLNDLMHRMEDVQSKYSRDVVVIGVLGPLQDNSRRRNSEPDPIRDLPATTETIETYVGNRLLNHHLVAMPEGVNIPLRNASSRRSSNGVPVGAVMIVSSDGVVRRAEFASRWEDLRRALDTTLRVDPGVKARRAAEDDFIRSGG